MKKLITSGLVALALTLSAYGYATAYWTGKSRTVRTVTNQIGVSCEYNYAGNKFWRTFVNIPCPVSVEVQ